MGRHKSAVIFCSDAFIGLCIQNSLLTVVALITLWFSVILLRKFLAGSEAFLGHRVIILYLFSAQCIAGIIHWAFWDKTFLDFIMELLKSLSFIVVYLFFVRNALKLIHHTEWIYRYLYPTGVFAAIATITVFICAVAHVFPNSEDCESPSWLIFASVEFIITVFIVIACFLLQSKLDGNVYSAGVKGQRRKRLMTIMLVYLFIAGGNLLYEVILKETVTEQQKCEAFFSGDQIIHAFIIVIVRALFLFAPAWASIWVFWDAAGERTSSSLSLLSSKNTETSSHSLEVFEDPDDLNHFGINPSDADMAEPLPQSNSNQFSMMANASRMRLESQSAATIVDPGFAAGAGSIMAGGGVVGFLAAAQSTNQIAKNSQLKKTLSQKYISSSSPSVSEGNLLPSKASNSSSDPNNEFIDPSVAELGLSMVDDGILTPNKQNTPGFSNSSNSLDPPIPVSPAASVPSLSQMSQIGILPSEQQL